MWNPSSSAAAGGGRGSSTSNKTPCCSKVEPKKGRWTNEEDRILLDYIKEQGEGNWSRVAKCAGLRRCCKSCRLRWMNYLCPSVNHGNIAPDEEDLILRLHWLLGNRWSLIAARIPGRTDNEIKNYWKNHLSKKLISQGIDPRTHKPLNPDYSSADHDHHHAKPSSSKTNRLPTPYPYNHPASPAEETPSGSGIPINKENEYFQTTNVDQYQAAGTDARGGNANLPNSDGSGMGLGSNNGLVNEEEYNINHFSDDVLNSFSMINEEEEAFTPQHQLHQQATTGTESVFSPFDFNQYCFDCFPMDCTLGSCDHDLWFQQN